MGRATFVAWLYITAAACVAIAIGDRKWAWLIGGIVFFSVAHAARRQLKKEAESGRKGVSISFFGIAILLMLTGMLFLFWLQFKAGT